MAIALASKDNKIAKPEGANNVFKAKNYCFLTEKSGCNRSTPPLYQPTVHLRFEI
jgi:hypothetical protein